MLKEADEWLYSMKCLLSVKTDEEDRAYTQKRIDLFNWLIEQAERFEVLAEQHDEALAQNKRYREALEKIRLGSKYGVPHCSTRVKSINKIATKALEESE